MYQRNVLLFLQRESLALPHQCGQLSSGIPRPIVRWTLVCSHIMATILVIEDDTAVRGLFQAVLQSAGHTVLLAATAVEAGEVLRGSAIEMVIMDLDLPQGSGLEVISLLLHDFPRTKVLAVAGETNAYDPLHVGSCLDAVEVLPKPLGVSHLLGTVHRVLACQ